MPAEADVAVVRVGLFGKLPARGDFVRVGLPRAFVDAWDAWLQTVIPESRERLGERWVEAWMVAPVWRFRLGPGLCGPGAALGLWMPSVDRAGRHFPLMLAAAARSVPCGEDDAWLDGAEQAGLDALEHDLDPEALQRRLSPPPPFGVSGAPMPSGGAWWTEGGPYVSPARRILPAMPDGATFAAMIRDETPAAASMQHGGSSP